MSSDDARIVFDMDSRCGLYIRAAEEDDYDECDVHRIPQSLLDRYEAARRETAALYQQIRGHTEAQTPSR